MMPDKYVLTSAPGADRDALLDRLCSLGIYAMREVASYVKWTRASQGRITAEMDRRGFQKEVLETQVRWEREIPQSVAIAMIERGLYDGIPFYNIEGKSAPHGLWKASLRAGYKGVFYLETADYHNSPIRPESSDKAAELGERTRRLYDRVGLTPVILPAKSLDEQVDIVLSTLERDYFGVSHRQRFLEKAREKHGLIAAPFPM